MQGFVGVMLLLLTALPAFAQPAIAPGGILRAAYLAGNPAQAIRDPATGVVSGPAADLARALAAASGVVLELRPIRTPPSVIEEVASGRADIGFVAFAPARAGTVAFSQTYELVRQSFVVRADSVLRSVREIDRSGLRIAGTTDDSITLYLRDRLRLAKLVPLANEPAEIRRQLLAGEIDAFGGNRQRLTGWAREIPGTRLLPDDLFGVPQTIIVPMGRAEVLAEVNRFIDGARASGLIARSIAASGLVGVDVAPGGSWVPAAP